MTDRDYAPKDWLKSPKPRFTLLRGVATPKAPETPLEAARRRYGRPFCSEPWATGEGVRYWTVDRVAELALANDRLRKARV